MELIYKLDLPELPLILTAPAQRKLFVGRDHPIYKQYHPKHLLQPQWLTYRGIEWDLVSFFYKHNYQGILHRDDGVNTWGINWIYQGHAKMEYWRDEDVISSEPQPDAIGSLVINCQTRADPSHIYCLQPGAYLVNAHRPHRVQGYDHRYALSLRCRSMNQPWDQVVDQFKDLIVG